MRWVRFVSPTLGEGFGTLEGEEVVVHVGEMFSGSKPSGERLRMEGVVLTLPCRPSKMVALWNNSRAAAEKQAWPIPSEPLYFLKPTSSFVPHGAQIRRPASYCGRILFEGELGVVIGATCVDVPIADVDDVIFGYTCINDVTALDLIDEDLSFPQWSRAKGFDTFGPFGPCIASGIEPEFLVVRTKVNGRLRQEFPVSDMFFGPRELVHRISRGMTLFAGDVIACGTSLGTLPMRPTVPVEVEIAGVGTLMNVLEE